ncbi:MAG TPA: DNA-binding protein WhiA, partial [Tissierellaceae bacterium]
SNPEKSYHLEFTTNNKEHSDNLCEIINSFNLSAKVVQRKENYVVYLKEGSQIVDLLNIIGAHQALLNFENVRVLKDMRNNVNRLVNCETANLSKTIDASMKQVENIKLIQDTKGLHTLPPKLREIAYLRLEYRDATLKEIGEMLDPPVSKSGVNHRFRNIEKIANNIKGV